MEERSCSKAMLACSSMARFLPMAARSCSRATLTRSSMPRFLPMAARSCSRATLPLLDAPLPADGGTLLLSGNASAPLDGTLMLSGGGPDEPLEGTLLLSGRDEPRGSKPASSAEASTMPGSAKAEGPQRGANVGARSSTQVRKEAGNTAVTPRKAGAETTQASLRTQGTTLATKRSTSSTMRRIGKIMLQMANFQVWLIVLTWLAVVAGVTLGWML